MKCIGHYEEHVGNVIRYYGKHSTCIYIYIEREREREKERERERETYMKYIGHRYESTATVTICIANHNSKSDSVWWIVLPELHLLFVSPPRVVRA